MTLFEVETQTRLAQLQADYDHPVRIGPILDAWRKRTMEGQPAMEEFRWFLDQQAAGMTRAVAAHEVTELATAGMAQMWRRSSYDPEEVMGELSRDLRAEGAGTAVLSAATLLAALGKLYGLANVASRDRDSIKQFLVTVRHAESYFKATVAVIENFVLDPEVMPDWFKTHAARERLVPIVTIDLVNDSNILLAIRHDLADLDSALSSRITTLLKIESSYRMVTNQNMQDTSLLGNQSRNRTLQPGEGYDPDAGHEVGNGLDIQDA